MAELLNHMKVSKLYTADDPEHSTIGATMIQISASKRLTAARADTDLLLRYLKTAGIGDKFVDISSYDGQVGVVIPFNLVKKALKGLTRMHGEPVRVEGNGLLWNVGPGRSVYLDQTLGYLSLRDTN